ncbi:Glucose transport transcription regulator [Trichinella spiralis]|uniref:Glucose transport transcription regulator n=1 Tax=Trichinella spiralis TaxID=6334 RepID=A0ABR3L296_TRISP
MDATVVSVAAAGHGARRGRMPSLSSVGRSVQMHRRPCRPKTTDGNVARKPADLISALTSSHALEERDQSPRSSAEAKRKPLQIGLDYECGSE